MRRFALSRIVDCMRRTLAVVLASLAILGAVYFGGHKLSNPDHYRAAGGGLCDHGPVGVVLTPRALPNCSAPTRYAWQIPLAILLAGLGLATIATVPGEPRRRAALPNRSV